jgi:hypothetical protein
MDPNVQLSTNHCPTSVKEITAMKHVPYCETIGSLMWVTVGMCPNIMFPIGVLSKFLDNPRLAHWEMVKHIVHYLQGTRDWHLTYSAGKLRLEGYSDSDRMSQEHRRAISGYVFIIDGGVVSWSSKKQELVMLSTTELRQSILLGFP